jgi:hypothetical protein
VTGKLIKFKTQKYSLYRNSSNVINQRNVFIM